MLANLQASGAIQARILENRIKYCNHAQFLADATKEKAGIQAIDRIKVKNGLQALLEKSVKLPFEVRCFLLEFGAHDLLEGMLEGSADSAAESAERLAALLCPFARHLGRTDDFDAFKPTVAPLMSELLDATTSAAVEIPSCPALDEDMQGEEGEEPTRDDQLVARWQAGLFSGS